MKFLSIHFHSVSRSVSVSILHFLLDQKVKQKIKSHPRRSGKMFSWTSCGKYGRIAIRPSLEMRSTFRMLLTNRNFSNPHFRGATDLSDILAKPNYLCTIMRINYRLPISIRTSSFRFQLNTTEFNLLKSQIATSKRGVRKLPWAYTEHGIA